MCVKHMLQRVFIHLLLSFLTLLLPLLPFFSSLDCASCSQGDETTMLSISRPSWGYRKIKTQVPRPWQTTPLQHQCVVTPFSSPTTEAKPTAAFVSCGTQNQLTPRIWPPRPHAMSFSFVATMMLVGSSAVIAFVLQPSKEELQAPGNSPAPHHRSVPDLSWKNKLSGDMLLGNRGCCKSYSVDSCHRPLGVTFSLTK